MQSGSFVALLAETEKIMAFLTKPTHAGENEGKTKNFHFSSDPQSPSADMILLSTGEHFHKFLRGK